jgi:F-type H+-transporting ATPase subunit alpha
MSIEKQIVSIWAGSTGKLDDVAVASIGAFEAGFLSYLESSHKKVLSAIAKEKAISEETEAGLKKAIEELKKTFSES